MPRPNPIGGLLLSAVLALPAASLAAQSVLDRSPNLSGGWIAPQGVLQFDFVHRFDASPAPERKVTSFPSFVLATGLPYRTMLGFVYSTNSTLVSRYPNEWEFFAGFAPMLQSTGRPLDIGVEAGYSLAAEGFVGELSLARRAGPVRLLAVGRLLAALDGDGSDGAVGGGAVVRLSRWIALAGDITSVIDRAPGEEVAWSAGLQLGLPHTPHTLSLQASNAIGLSLESASRGTSETLYGFEFTIPITFKRYLGGKADSAGADATVVPAGKPAVIHIKNLAYGKGALTITAGTTVEWVNDDPLAHTVVAADSSYDSGLIEPGATWRHLFSVPGTYSYTCRPHPFMKGTITVVAAP